MKKCILLLFILALFSLSGCQTAYHVQWPHYETTDALIEASDEVFEGQLVDTFIEVIDTSTGKVSTSLPVSDTLYRHTVYEISVKDTLKGSQTDTKYICIMHSSDTPALELGADYLFVACDLDGDYLYVPNPYQFAFSPNTKNTTDDPSYQSILDYFE